MKHVPLQVFDVTDGQIEFEVNRVDPENKEIGGVFVSKQKGDTDMGSKVPKDILVKGECVDRRVASQTSHFTAWKKPSARRLHASQPRKLQIVLGLSALSRFWIQMGTK